MIQSQSNVKLQDSYSYLCILKFFIEFPRTGVFVSLFLQK